MPGVLAVRIIVGLQLSFKGLHIGFSRTSVNSVN